MQMFTPLYGNSGDIDVHPTLWEFWDHRCIPHLMRVLGSQMCTPPHGSSEITDVHYCPWPKVGSGNKNSNYFHNLLFNVLFKLHKDKTNLSQ